MGGTEGLSVTNPRTITKYTDRRLHTFVTRVTEMTAHGRWCQWVKRRSDHPSVTGQDPFFKTYRALIEIQTSDRLNMLRIRITSGFCRGVNDIFVHLRSYAAYSAIYRRFGTSYRVPSWRVQQSSLLVVLTVWRLTTHIWVVPHR